jgi:uncharacterized Fe-S cluster-containing radical SAM superfamily protein
MTLDFIIETVVVGLLIATCGYCYVLSRRLRTLRAGQEEMLAVIEKFDEASRRAEKTLTAMQTNGALVSHRLNDTTERATQLIDELSVMIHAGDRIAGRIEIAAGAVRGDSRGRAA